MYGSGSLFSLRMRRLWRHSNTFLRGCFKPGRLLGGLNA